MLSFKSAHRMALFNKANKLLLCHLNGSNIFSMLNVNKVFIIKVVYYWIIH